jgi:hypothetical protein
VHPDLEQADLMREAIRRSSTAIKRKAEVRNQEESRGPDFEQADLRLEWKDAHARGREMAARTHH